MTVMAANYLLEHWKDKKIVPLVVVDSDADVKAISKNYRYVTNLLNYVKGMPKSDDRYMLIERVKEMTKVEEKGHRPLRYPAHWSDRDLDAGLRAGNVKIGNFAVCVNLRLYICILSRSHTKTSLKRLFKSTKQCVFSFTACKT
jgi:hypothetical protein